MESTDHLRERLSAIGQDHVLAFHDELCTSEQAALTQALSELDFEQIKKDFAKAIAGQ